MALTRKDVDRLPESARRKVLAQLEPHKAVPDECNRLPGPGIILLLPPKELAPNSRVCWQAKMRAKREYRQHAKDMAYTPRPPRWKLCRVQCRFFFTQNRRRDPDNLLAWMKSGFDGLTDAGIWADDCGLTHLPPVVAIDRDNPRVEIVVTPEPEQA